MAEGYPQVSPVVKAALAKENQSPLIIGVVAVFTGLGLVAVLLRFFTRIKFVGVVGLEDYFIALSMVCIRCAHHTYMLRLTHFADILSLHLCMPNTRCKIWQWKALD